MVTRNMNSGSMAGSDLSEPGMKKGPLGQGAVNGGPVPWVSASEMQPSCQCEDSALDDIDEASMESFPCSDPPSHHGQCHA